MTNRNYEVTLTPKQTVGDLRVVISASTSIDAQRIAEAQFDMSKYSIRSVYLCD